MNPLVYDCCLAGGTAMLGIGAGLQYGVGAGLMTGGAVLIGLTVLSAFLVRGAA